MFIQGMQACLGDDYEPRVRKQVHRANGEYESNKDGVPQNFITVKYLLHAYSISYTTFKRMKHNQALVPVPKPAHKNKGKSVFEDKAFAEGFYSPYRMYLKQKYAEWLETEVGRNADAQRKKVKKRNPPLIIYFKYNRSIAFLRQLFRIRAKAAFATMPDKEKEPYNKLARDQIARFLIKFRSIIKSLNAEIVYLQARNGEGSTIECLDSKATKFICVVGCGEFSLYMFYIYVTDLSANRTMITGALQAQ